MKHPALPLASIAALAAVAACHHPVAPIAAPAPAPVAAPAPPPPPSAADLARAHADSLRNQVRGESAPVAQTGAWGIATPDSSALADRLHFDFNDADLSQADLGKLEVKRQVLDAHATLHIEIDGNADERGSDEYNLALGLRRAAAAKRWLVAHGIDESRIKIISYGEEKPLDPAHSDSAWAANRRDGFTVLMLGR